MKAIGNFQNIDPKVVEDFGKEWETYNQKPLTGNHLLNAFNQYFHIFPFEQINDQSIGFDMGCGSGRWAQLVAPKVGKLRCIDPSEGALAQARSNLSHLENCEFELASVADSSLPNGSQDFGYCLGVLHHIPDTQAGLESCTKKLKSGAPFLVYLYYRFDNKPLWFRIIWRMSDLLRRVISKLPFRIKLALSNLIAALVYWPLAKLSLVLEKLGADVGNVPLSDYRNKPFYFLRTDALDRFGTRLEQRFTRDEIEQMMTECGLERIRFSGTTPYWVAVGFKR